MRGIDQLAAAMLVAALAATPFGIAGALPACTHPLWLAWGIGVGLCSSVIPYVTDQLAMARLPRASFALMLALLPAAATVIGLLILGQVPAPQDLLGVGLVIVGVALHDTPVSARPERQRIPRKELPMTTSSDHAGARIHLGDGLITGQLGYGAMGLAEVYGPIDEAEALATLHHVVDVGIDLIDTADTYGAGSNEQLISRLLSDRRAEVTLATKFGIVSGTGTDATMTTRNDAAYARQACEASPRRLGTDVIDLFYLHRRQVSVPLEEVIGAMAQLVSCGKVRHLGLSEVTADELRRAHAVHPIAAVQSEWSLWSRDVERYVVPAAAELGVGFVAYAPLGRGFLTGTIASAAELDGDWRAELERFQGRAFDTNQALVAAVRGIAREHDATAAQVALAWLRQRGTQLGLPAVPIPGTRRPARVEENLRSLSLDLDEEAVSALDALAADVVGSRSTHSDPDWVSESRE